MHKIFFPTLQSIGELKSENESMICFDAALTSMVFASVCSLCVFVFYECLEFGCFDPELFLDACAPFDFEKCEELVVRLDEKKNRRLCVIIRDRYPSMIVSNHHKNCVQAKRK